ncbi:c-type cytochrome [Halioglobus pacificus]|uniref:Cytochrome c domain-containing protein n=1 Tax=Parahalioglobus pacificus TaxID=930806 RepID=A0A918XF25_9GAMM|nr:c-type cytochrome [Halioglobus pacificus]GHD29254.1 hypothetical protein GCM10007053_09440 [Halioglobus pacificus]
MVSVSKWNLIQSLCSVLAVVAVPTVFASPDERQISLFISKCVQCHAQPHTGAPQVGVPEDWESVIDQGEDATLVNVVHGIRGMPPLGYCSACDEKDLRVLTRFAAGFPDPEEGKN